MEEKQKVQVVFEFDRSEYDAYLFLMNQKKTKEVEQIWNTMSGEPVVADIDLLEEDSQSVKLMMNKFGNSFSGEKSERMIWHRK